MTKGEFREDLLARINLWTFALPGLAQRTKDIAPNLDHELENAARRLGRRVGMAKDVRAAFLDFAPLGRGEIECELPGPERRRDAHVHARTARTYYT